MGHLAVVALKTGGQQSGVQKLDPEKPAFPIEVQDDVPHAVDRILGDALADRLARPDVSQVEAARIDLPVPGQPQCHPVVAPSWRVSHGHMISSAASPRSLQLTGVLERPTMGQPLEGVADTALTRATTTSPL